MIPEDLSEAQRRASAWAAAHPREASAPSPLNRPPLHAKLDAWPVSRQASMPAYKGRVAGTACRPAPDAGAAQTASPESADSRGVSAGGGSKRV